MVGQPITDPTSGSSLDFDFDPDPDPELDNKIFDVGTLQCSNGAMTKASSKICLLTPTKVLIISSGQH